MTKSEFPFVIGYQGQTAIIDKNMYSKWKSASLAQLLDAGLFKAAFSRAVWDQDAGAMEKVLLNYNARSPKQYASVEVLQRAFGVYSVPQGVKRTLYL